MRMPVKNFRLFLIILVVIIAACTPHLDQPTPTTLSEPTSTSVPTATPRASAATPASQAGFQSPHPWEEPAEFDQILSLTTRNAPNEILTDASEYHLQLNIPEDLDTSLNGKLAVRYTNQEEADLPEIIFRLFPNFYGGSLRVENLMANEQPVTTRLESKDTTLRVTLSEPLSPGEDMILTMDFSLTLPFTMGGNYGLLGFFDNILVLDTFYPVIPAYDQEGWYAHYPYPAGDLTYQDAAYYLVEVTAPADFVLATSGSMISSETSGSRQTAIYAAGPARDFYLAGSSDFTVISTEVDGIQINSYALTGARTNQELALTFAAQAVETFSELLVPYPYTEFDVVSSPMLALGIEYPGITGIYKDLYIEDGNLYGMSNEVLLETVIVHEVGHQWFYNLVGNDQQDQPWVDESVTQYITYLYYIQRGRVYEAAGQVQDWRGRLSYVDDAGIPLGLSADQYKGAEYSAIVYGRGPLFYLDLSEQLGPETVLSALRQYLQDYRWQSGDTLAIQQELEAACNCDLTEQFDDWVLSPRNFKP